ncbi:putative prolyl oligopeptidase [Trypanosoma vivax]|nr:putative prolyl oligopeptidase [Trypanosoma vivax]
MRHPGVGRRVIGSKARLNGMLGSNNGNGCSADSVCQSASISPPKYTRREYKMEHFGETRVDPYYWLRNRHDPEVRQLLLKENANMESVFATYGGKRLCRTLYNEMRARWKEDDVSLPYRDRGYWYYTRSVPNADHPLFCRRKVTHHNENFEDEASQFLAKDASATLPPFDDEVVFFDLNLFALEQKLEYVELGDMDISPNGLQLAVSIDCSNGREVYTIFVLDIVNVNYIQWLQQYSSLGRAWATTMAQSSFSIYQSPTSALVKDFNLKKTRVPGSKSTHVAGLLTERFGSCDGEGDSGPCCHDSPHEKDASKNTLKDSTDVSCPSCPFPSYAETHTAAFSSRRRKAPPSHKISRRVDVFDVADEVLWLSDTSFLYLALDERMRSHRVIFHDLTKPLDSTKSDIICYEEPDEAYWVSSLCFSADEQYVLFTTSSGSATEVYVGPCDAGVKRRVSGVPIVAGWPEEEDSESTSWSRTVPSMCESSSSSASSLSSTRESTARQRVTMFRFTSRAPQIEYDIDHHSSLFGETVGAWLVTLSGAPQEGINYSIGYVLDQDIVWDRHSTTSLCATSQWQPLFAYDPCISVEGVECTRDYLLFSVRRAASSTVLLLPVKTLWKRLSGVHTSNWSVVQPMSLRNDTFDLSCIACSPLGNLEEVCIPLAEWSHFGQQQQQLELMEGGTIHSLKSCTSDTAFCSAKWRVAVTHLIIPTVTLSFTFVEEQERKASVHVKQLYQSPVVGPPYKAEDYDATITWVPSDFAFSGSSSLQPLPTKEPVDPVRVPVYLCWKRSLFQRGTNPMLLTVYGSYGDCLDVEFESERLALLDRGFVWAAAGVRGGGELGTLWHEAGRKLQRATTVNDFVSVAHYVQNSGWCATGRLVTYGASAGAFVVTAAMNVAPQQQLAIIAAVPFVDCLTTLLDPTLPLTVSEWEEFGNPSESLEAYRIVRSISPIDNIPPVGVGLPHIFFLTAWQDTRVGYWESLAFTARLRERQVKERDLAIDAVDTNDSSSWFGSRRQVLLHFCDFGAGHGGASGRYQHLLEVAREYAFAILIQQTVCVCP